MRNDDPSLFEHATAECVTSELNRIGEAVHCCRLFPRETNRAFAHRLVLHVQLSIMDRKQLLELILSLSRSETRSNSDERQ